MSRIYRHWNSCRRRTERSSLPSNPILRTSSNSDEAFVAPFDTGESLAPERRMGLSMGVSRPTSVRPGHSETVVGVRDDEKKWCHPVTPRDGRRKSSCKKRIRKHLPVDSTHLGIGGPRLATSSHRCPSGTCARELLLQIIGFQRALDVDFETGHLRRSSISAGRRGLECVPLLRADGSGVDGA